MSETWYLTGHWRDEIKPVTVTRSTEQSVWTLSHNGTEERRGRVTQWGVYFRTYSEARAHVIRRATDAVASLERQLAAKRADLERVQALPLEAR